MPFLRDTTAKHRAASMQFIETLSQRHISQLHELYQAQWWSLGRSLEQTQQVVQHSSLCVGVENTDGDLLAFARVISDFTFKAFIFDVIVHPEHQGTGLGRQLVFYIQNHALLKTVQHIELYCKDDVQGFYQQLGFSVPHSNIQLMRYCPAGFSQQ